MKRLTKMSPANFALQIGGFIVCIGLLVWLIGQALNDENREQMKQLALAPWYLAAGLVFLSGATMVLNGVLFWVVIRPHRRVPLSDIQAVNAVAYLLSGVPLRGGFLFRIFVHHRRNRVPFIVVGGWMAATAALIVVGFGPPSIASFWRGELDLAWWITTAVGILAGSVVVVLVARFMAFGRGWAMVRSGGRRLEGTWVAKIFTMRRLARILEGVRMLANPGAVFASGALRFSDLMIQALRFAVAAAMIGVDLPLDQAVLAACVFFVADSVAPTGSIGAREAITVGFLSQFGDQGLDVMVLTVSASEMVVRTIGAAAGLLWLAPGGLFTPRGSPNPPKPAIAPSTPD